jgi:hypothetical protein
VLARYPLDVGNEETVYQVVAARRLQWDQLVWQVPVLSLTAQAFLFTIALGSGSSRTARAVAALLSLVTSFLSVELMSRHRQAEMADARWLEKYEDKHFPNEKGYVVHGLAFRDARNASPAGPLGKLPGYWTWLCGLGLFGLAALVVLGLVVMHPQAFQ